MLRRWTKKFKWSIKFHPTLKRKKPMQSLIIPAGKVQKRSFITEKNFFWEINDIFEVIKTKQ